MNWASSRSEKQAWFMLTVVVLACLTYCVLMPWLGPKRACGAFGLLGLMGFAPLFAWKGRADREVLFDERDRTIHSRSTVVAFAVFWLTFVGSCMIPWCLYLQQGSVPVEILPLILLIGWIVFSSTQALAILVQYRRGRDAH
jgi:hypothetical protein